MKKSLTICAVFAVLFCFCGCKTKFSETDDREGQVPTQFGERKDSFAETEVPLGKFRDEMKIAENGDKLQPLLEAKNSAPYKIEIGDVIEISVLDEPEMTREVSVIPDGTVTYLLIGEIPAAGKTIKEFREILTGLVGEYFVNPRVSVIMKKLHDTKIGEFSVSAIGALQKPGKYRIERGDRLTDVIAEAGGLLYINDVLGGRTIANLNASYISRNGAKLDVDFDKLLRLGEMKYNIELKDDDFIYIGEADTETIIVMGEVGNPRIIPHNRDISLVEAISVCGGFTEKAARSEVLVLRNSEMESKCVKVDVESLLFGKAGEKNMLLSGGDIIFVPEQGLSEYSRYADYLLTFGDLILKGYSVREQIRFPRIHRRDAAYY